MNGHRPADKYYNDSSRWDGSRFAQRGPALGVGATGSPIATLRLLQQPKQFVWPEPIAGQPLPTIP